MKRSILYNPFYQIAGLKSLVIGLFGSLVLTFLAFETGTHFNGLLNVDFAKDSKYWVFAAENLSNWLFISAFLYISGLIFSRSRIRLIDISGTALLSRIPLIL